MNTDRRFNAGRAYHTRLEQAEVDHAWRVTFAISLAFITGALLGATVGLL